MKKITIFACLYLISIIVFLAHFIYVGRVLYGDALYYYSYLPSVFADHTLNLTNSFTHLEIHQGLTHVGLPENKYSIGPALFWSIPYIVTSTFLNFIGIHNPYSLYYQIIIGIWDITLVFIGLYFLYLTLKRFFTEELSLLTVFIVFLTTNLLFYGAVDVINSHSISFLLSCLFIYFWIKKQNFKTSIALGILLGLTALVRPQDGTIIVLPLFTLFRQRVKYFMNFLTICFVSLITFLPQLFVWHTIWGSWITNPYLYHEAFTFLHPQILGVLLGKQSGLFLWTPILAFGFIGLIIFSFRQKAIGIPLLTFFLLQLYIIASWSTWWQGASYSGRMFISSIPFLAIGLATLLSVKFVYRLRYLLIILFTTLNFMLMLLFLLKY